MRVWEWAVKDTQWHCCAVCVCVTQGRVAQSWWEWNEWTLHREQRRMMNMSAELRLLVCLILAAVGFTLGFGSNQGMQFTFLLPAGSTECFYQTTARNDSMEIQYQVKINIVFPCLSLMSVCVSVCLLQWQCNVVFKVWDGFIKVCELCLNWKTRLWTLVLHVKR